MLVKTRKAANQLNLHIYNLMKLTSFVKIVFTVSFERKKINNHRLIELSETLQSQCM